MEEGPSASECPVCFVQLSDQRVPMSMPCGHTLCKCCIDQLGSSSVVTTPDGKPSFPCPLCRQWVAVDGVTINVTLRDLLEELRRPHPRAGGGVGTALNIPYGDIKFTDMLDRGAFGEVHRAYWQGYEVAVKVFSSGKLTSDTLQAFQREVLVMNALRHPNVVLLMGACQTPPRLCIVMEFVGGGSLHDLLYIDKVTMGLPDAQQVSLCTCRGLQYLHSINIMHRDLKSKNVLLTGPLPCQAKLCDFGLARLRQENATMTGNIGTVHWTAPEIMVSKRYQFPADVYSFGMVLYEMATNKIPFHEMNPMAVMLAVAIQKQRPPISPGVDPKLADLIERCTRWEPEERPPVGTVLQCLLDLVPMVERTKSHSSAQLELNHTNSLGYVFVLASKSGVSNPGKDTKETDSMDGLKKEVMKDTSFPPPPPPELTSPTSGTHRSLPSSDTADLQLALKLQKEEEEARRLLLEADEQLAEQLQNKENTFVVPVEDVPSVKGPPPQLLKTIKSGNLVLKRTQSPKTQHTYGDHHTEVTWTTPTSPPPSLPPPPPPPPAPPVPIQCSADDYEVATLTRGQKIMASIRNKVAQMGRHLRPVTTVEKRAFRVGRVVEEESPPPIATLQYEVAKFDKRWLNQVPFLDYVSTVPVGRVVPDKGYPLKGTVQSLKKLWKSAPQIKKNSPQFSRKMGGAVQTRVDQERGADSNVGSSVDASDEEEKVKPLRQRSEAKEEEKVEPLRQRSEAKKSTVNQKVPMQKRSISEGAVSTKPPQQSRRSHSHTKDVEVENDSIHEGRGMVELAGVSSENSLSVEKKGDNTEGGSTAKEASTEGDTDIWSATQLDTFDTSTKHSTEQGAVMDTEEKLSLGTSSTHSEGAGEEDLRSSDQEEPVGGEKEKVQPNSASQVESLSEESGEGEEKGEEKEKRPYKASKPQQVKSMKKMELARPRSTPEALEVPYTSKSLGTKTAQKWSDKKDPKRSSVPTKQPFKMQSKTIHSAANTQKKETKMSESASAMYQSEDANEVDSDSPLSEQSEGEEEREEKEDSPYKVSKQQEVKSRKMKLARPQSTPKAQDVSPPPTTKSLGIEKAQNSWSSKKSLKPKPLVTEQPTKRPSKAEDDNGRPSATFRKSAK